MLHIVNGDSVADKLKQTSLQGDILVWREIYSVGPVFEDMTNGYNLDLRAKYLERSMGIPRKMYRDLSRDQLGTLQNFRSYKEVVLWFEHDLFDQTMLCYLLHWFSQQALGDTKLHLLCIGEYPGIEDFRGLGQLDAEQLETLIGTWRPIGEQELTVGSKVWTAYSSSEPAAHLGILQEDTSALPFVHAAYEAHLARLPSTANGLGIVEQTTLELIADEIHAPYTLFEGVEGKWSVLGMGDLEYWHRLARMAEEPYPLVHVEGGAAFPSFSGMDPAFRDQSITITELGRKVLAGEANWAAVKSTDEWYGGLQLQGPHVSWRWDEDRKKIVQL